MTITKEKKTALVEEHRKGANDTGYEADQG